VSTYDELRAAQRVSDWEPVRELDGASVGYYVLSEGFGALRRCRCGRELRGIPSDFDGRPTQYSERCPCGRVWQWAYWAQDRRDRTGTWEPREIGVAAHGAPGAVTP
jgi:hypothetical protein